MSVIAAGITREDLDREIRALRELENTRYDMLVARLIAVEGLSTQIQLQLVRMESDARWFRKVSASVFGLVNAAALAVFAWYLRR